MRNNRIGENNTIESKEKILSYFSISAEVNCSKKIINCESDLVLGLQTIIDNSAKPFKLL